MISLDVVQDDKALQQIHEAFDRTPAIIERFVRKDIQPFTQGLITRRLRKEPGKVKYPIQWTSAKQRKAFFATDGFGHGIPYQRTGGLVHDWHLIVDRVQGFTGLTITNENPAAMYVYGDGNGKHQQGFHINTGWPTFVEQVQVITLAVSDRIDERLPNVLAAAFLGESQI